MNNPQNNVFKIVGLLVVVFIAGYFVVGNIHNRTNTINNGQVYSGSTNKTPDAGMIMTISYFSDGTCVATFIDDQGNSISFSGTTTFNSSGVATGCKTVAISNAGGGSIGPTTSFALTGNTSLGAKDIFGIQLRLVKMGLLAKENATSVYDQATTNAIKAFQNSRKITATGMIDSATANELNKTTITVQVKK